MGLGLWVLWIHWKPQMYPGGVALSADPLPMNFELQGAGEAPTPLRSGCTSDWGLTLRTLHHIQEAGETPAPPPPEHRLFLYCRCCVFVENFFEVPGKLVPPPQI